MSEGGTGGGRRERGRTGVQYRSAFQSFNLIGWVRVY